MKNILRLALPALADFGEDSPLPYAWFDRRGAARGKANSRCARWGTPIRRPPAKRCCIPPT
ncbi:hypothetical protein WJ976_10655 [Achromobacter denitrificans]